MTGGIIWLSCNESLVLFATVLLSRSFLKRFADSSYIY